MKVRENRVALLVILVYLCSNQEDIKVLFIYAKFFILFTKSVGPSFDPYSWVVNES